MELLLRCIQRTDDHGTQGVESGQQTSCAGSATIRPAARPCPVRFSQRRHSLPGLALHRCGLPCATQRCCQYVCSIALATIAATPSVATEGFQIEEATIASIQQALQDKEVTCRQIVQAYLDRIAAYDHKGPALAAILTLNSKARAETERLDAEYARSGPVGPFHCISLILKDNYNTADLPTTGGSASLAGAQPQ
jgi:hypothetical protein